MRKAISQALPEEVEAGTPLYLLLDDLAGASLISGSAFFKWAKQVPAIDHRRRRAQRVRYATSVRASAPDRVHSPREGTIDHVSDNTPHPSPFVDPDNPPGWHELHPHPAIAMRRARRIDVWWGGRGNLQIDAMFRDSVWDPEGLECVLHEYQMLG